MCGPLRRPVALGGPIDREAAVDALIVALLVVPIVVAAGRASRAARTSRRRS